MQVWDIPRIVCSCFFSKHRLWILFRRPNWRGFVLIGRFLWSPTISLFWAEISKHIHISCFISNVSMNEVDFLEQWADVKSFKSWSTRHTKNTNFSPKIGNHTVWFDSCAGLGGSVGRAVRLETRRSRVQPRRGRQHSSVEIDHEIFSTVILSLPLIQEGQLSVSGERMCTLLVNRLED